MVLKKEGKQQIKSQVKDIEETMIKYDTIQNESKYYKVRGVIYLITSTKCLPIYLFQT